MERLTKHHFKKQDGFYMTCSEHCSKEDFSCEDCGEFDKLVDRLGTIEDILGDDYDLGRLRELVEADRDGRCVVLPCKVGDAVYLPDRNNMKVLKKEVHQISFNHYGDQLVFAGCIVINVKKFGENVFLTPEAAQAALERMKRNE